MAKFDPCAPLPNPTSQQAVTKSFNRFGCYYSRRNAWRKKHPGLRLHIQFGVSLFRLGPHNWLWHRQISHRWSTVLTGLQRLAWDTLAGLMTYKNYYGNNGYPNGFNLFYALNRRYLWQAGGFKDDPPGAWDATAKPAPDSWQLFDSDLVLTYPFDFNPAASLSGGAVVSPDPVSGSGIYPPHYWTTNRLTWGFNGFNWITDVYIDYDFSQPLLERPRSVGVFHQDTTTGQFTDFLWIPIP